MACRLERWSFQRGMPLLIRSSLSKKVIASSDSGCFYYIIMTSLTVVELDEGVVMQLASMGFDLEGCKRAVFHTHNQG